MWLRQAACGGAPPRTAAATPSPLQLPRAAPRPRARLARLAPATAAATAAAATTTAAAAATATAATAATATTTATATTATTAATTTAATATTTATATAATTTTTAATLAIGLHIQTIIVSFQNMLLSSDQCLFRQLISKSRSDLIFPHPLIISKSNILHSHSSCLIVNFDNFSRMILSIFPV